MKDLLQRAQNGDGDAFAELFQEHVPMLWKMAVSLLRSEDAAADALQECTIKAWRACPRFGGDCALSTWLARILLNTCYDHLRIQRKVVPFATLAEGEACADADALFAKHDHDISEEHIQEMDVQATLDRLNANDRLVLTLFYVSDLPTAQIAQMLGISDGAVRTRLARARERFKGAYLAAEAGASAGCEDAMNGTMVEVAI